MYVSPAERTLAGSLLLITISPQEGHEEDHDLLNNLVRCVYLEHGQENGSNSCDLAFLCCNLPGIL